MVDIDCKPGLKQFQLDPEWLAIVKAADIFFPKSYTAHLPSDEEFSMQIEIARRWLEHQQVELAPPEFEMTAPVEDTDELFNNPQTFEICKRLGIPCRFNPRHDAGMLEVNPEIMNISDSDD